MISNSAPVKTLTTDKKFLALAGTGTLETIATVFKFKPDTLK